MTLSTTNGNGTSKAQALRDLNREYKPLLEAADNSRNSATHTAALIEREYHRKIR
jgi:hypothetical protein